MASYPTAVRTFSTKATNDTIEASHVNDLQAEITALEDGLINALGHDLKFTDATFDIGKSGASRPRDLFLSRNLTVGGTFSLGGNIISNLLFTDGLYDIGASGATRPRDFFFSRNGLIGGTLGVTGITSLSDDLKLAALKKFYLDGGGDSYLIESAANTLDAYTNAVRALTIDSTQFIDSPTQPRCVAYNSAAQTLSDNTETRITFDSEEIDVGALHSTSVNTGRLTIPAGGDGVYLVFGSLVFAANATGYRYLYVLKNGVTTISPIAYVTPMAAAGVTVPVQTLVVLAAGDYIELWGRQTSGGNLNAGGAQPNANTFSIVKLW